MNEIVKYSKISLYSLLHFLTDGICALIIFQFLYTEDYNTCVIVFLTYNFLAFLGQPFVGLIIDKHQKTNLFLFISIIFLILGVAFENIFVISAICLGIGNAIFHVTGGKYCITKTNNNIVTLGIFVAPGVIGLTLGERFYSNTLLIIFLSLTLIFATIIAILKEPKLEEINTQKKEKSSQYIFLLSILGSAVLIRSFVGKVVILDFSKTELTFVLIACSIAIGKALGGILSQLIGKVKTLAISISVAIICLCFFNSSIWLSLLGLIAFNCSMPITLWYANEALPNHEGFTFGLMAASLIPGYLLGMISYSRLAILIMIFILCIIQTLFVIIVERKMKK